MGVTFVQSVELAAYQLQYVAHTWYKEWKYEKIDDEGPIEWEEFVMAFIDRFFPQ